MSQWATTNIVESVADAKSIDPTELEYSVREYIDLEAIEKLAEHDNASWTLSFELPEHNVTVTSDGLILVDGVKEEIWA